jgi:nitrogen fixation protein NifU and related proteins
VAVPEPQFDELYRELILDHYRSPRNKGDLRAPTHTGEGANPVCGDEIRLSLIVDDGMIEDIAFEGMGCSISQSSASMMTSQIKGRSTDEALRILGLFEAMMTKEAEPDRDIGDLEALQGVAKFPVRVKCAMLSWKVLDDSLQGTYSNI